MALKHDPSRKCAQCRAPSPTGAGYVQLSGDFYCPWCYPKARAKKAEWSWVRWVALVVMALFMTRVKPPADHLGWLLLNAYTILLFDLVVTLPHELGHAIAGHLLDARVHRVIVGLGPLLWKRAFLGGTLEIHRYWIGGGTICLDRRVSGFRLRHWVTVVCGPLASVVLLAAVLPFLRRPYSLEFLDRRWDPLADFALSNLLILVFNLIPRRTRSLRGLAMTDGLALLRTPFLKSEEVRKMASLFYGVPAAERIQAQQYEEALQLHEDGLREFPEALLLRHDRAVVLLNLGRMDEAREQFLELSKAPGFDPQVRLLCVSNVAAADILLERPELVEEADRCSMEAMTSMAWHPGVRATRGSVLIAQGRVDEGIALAREGMARMDEDRARAAAACTLAIGLHQKGDLAEGRKYLEMAEQLGPRSPRLPRVRELYGRGIAQ